jgi:tetratricopeptide (TPR) repeat protein
MYTCFYFHYYGLIIPIVTVIVALQRYDEADADARRALILDKTYLKGYFRLASSLKARKLYIEAAGVASLGLDVDPDNAPLRKIKTACTKESAAQTNANSKKIFGNLYNDKNSSSHKSGDGSHSSRPKSNAMSSSSKANKIADSTSASKSGLSEIENKMLHSVKTLVSRLQNGDFSSSEADLHMLQGTFRKLVDTDTFADLVFPGVPADVLKGLPCTLNELLQWKSMSMMVDEAMPKVAIAAGKIFEGSTCFRGNA